MVVKKVKIDMKKMMYYITYIYIVLKFIIFISQKTILLLDYAYMYSMSILAIINYKKENKFTLFPIAIITVLCAITAVEYMINQYGTHAIIESTIFIILAYLLFLKDDMMLDDNKKIDYIYIITILYLIWFIINAYLNNTLNIGNNTFYLLYAQDKNWSGLVIFLFMCLCYKKKYIFGIVISLIYMVFLDCRMSQFGTILFFALEFFKKNKSINRVFEKVSNFNVKQILLTIVASQILLIIFSYYCTYNIPMYKISKYKTSVIDESNAMRVRANVYAMEEFKKNPSLLIKGYDDRLKFKLGVEDKYHSPKFLGFRLVQPHSLLLNLLLKYGAVYTIFYLICVSYLLKRYWTNENLTCILVYLIMNMILPFLFSTAYLIYLIFVLASTKNETKIRFEKGVIYYENRARAVC